MSKLAVVTEYMEEQNEPSKPNKQLILVPDDIAARDLLLAEMYKAAFDDDDDAPIEDGDITVIESKDYGDLCVSATDSFLHMFITYVELPSEF